MEMYIYMVNDRLMLLADVETGIAEGEVLRLALQHAVAELDGLGGAVHLFGGRMAALRLVSTVGLSPESVRPWEIIGKESPAVPARAVRRRGRAWEATGSGGAGTGIRWPGTGLASVALSDGISPLGSLTVVTGSAGKPTEEQWRFLESVASWARRRVDQAPSPSPPTHEDPGGSRLRQALKAVEVGTWDWNIRTGELAWDDAAMTVYGTTPSDFVPRVETWLKVVHPDDLRRTLAAAEKAIRNRGVFEAEYRVRRPDGSYGWTETRAKVVLDEFGEAHRMIGTAWESNEPRSARDALSRALRYMSDGFLAADEDWRITFVNLEAEDMLGASEEGAVRPGAVDAAVAAARSRPGVAVQKGRGRGGAHELRRADARHGLLLPGPPGPAARRGDALLHRRHRPARNEAEQAAAERAAGERAARIAELTAALAKATTSRDVVDAVAQRVLPLFGATGLLVQALEDGRTLNVGSVGYPQSFLDDLHGRHRGAGDPVWDAISTGPVFVSSAEEYAERYPAMAQQPHLTGKKSWAFLPLTASGLTFGVCVVSFDEPRRLTGEERTLLSAISALVAHALERARAVRRRAQPLP